MTQTLNAPAANSLKNSRKVVAITLLLLTFGWMLFLTQGLPIGDPDDWDHVLAARDLSWPVLAENVLVPWSKSELWDGQIDRMNEVTHRRTFLSVVLKTIHTFAGDHFFPYFIFSKAIFFSGTVMLLFLLLSKIADWRFALGGALFYLLAPAHYPHLLWLTDPICMVHFFIILGLWFHQSLLSNLQNSESFSQFLKKWALFTACGWIALKTKEPGAILPISLIIYHFLNLGKWKEQKSKLALLFLSLGWLIFLLVPIEHLGAEAKNPVRFIPENISRMVFRNYTCGYDDEAVSAFFSWEHVWPGSLARTFGFFFLWFFVASLIIYVIKRIQKSPLIRETACAPSTRSLIHITLIWTILEIILMGKFQPDPRYFSGTLIPLTILSVFLISRVSLLLKGIPKRLFLMAAIFSLGFAVYENAQHVLYYRVLFGKRVGAFLSTAKTIYQDLYPNEPQDYDHIWRFGAAAYIPDPQAPRITRHLFYSPLGYGQWLKTEKREIALFEEFAKQGFIYDVTDGHQERFVDPRVQNIAVISRLNQGSILEHLFSNSKKKTLPPLYIDKWVGP